MAVVLFDHRCSDLRTAILRGLGFDARPSTKLRENGSVLGGDVAGSGPARSTTPKHPSGAVCPNWSAFSECCCAEGSPRTPWPAVRSTRGGARFGAEPRLASWVPLIALVCFSSASLSLPYTEYGHSTDLTPTQAYTVGAIRPGPVCVRQRPVEVAPATILGSPPTIRYRATLNAPATGREHYTQTLTWPITGT
jgi:hypothetical protein